MGASNVLGKVLTPSPAGPSNAFGASDGTSSNPTWVYAANDSHMDNSAWTVATSGASAIPYNYLPKTSSQSPTGGITAPVTGGTAVPTGITANGATTGYPGITAPLGQSIPWAMIGLGLVALLVAKKVLK